MKNYDISAILLSLENATLQYNLTGEFSAVKQLIDSFPEGFAQYDFVKMVFWRSLEQRSYLLAERLIVEGFTVEPVEPLDFGALYSAMERFGDCPDIIEWLLSHGAELERRSHNNWTPLMAAVFRGFYRAASVLLDNGAEINASTMIDDDRTSLMIAARNGNREIARLLIDHGATTSLRDFRGKDAITIARESGFEELAQFILNHQKV